MTWDFLHRNPKLKGMIKFQQWELLHTAVLSTFLHYSIIPQPTVNEVDWLSYCSSLLLSPKIHTLTLNLQTISNIFSPWSLWTLVLSQGLHKCCNFGAKKDMATLWPKLFGDIWPFLLLLFAIKPTDSDFHPQCYNPLLSSSPQCWKGSS